MANVWISTQASALGSPDVQEELLAMVQNADVSSRIGEFDAEAFELVPRG
jgi:hypothetical protein